MSTAPQHKMSLPELAAQCASEAAADTLFAQLSNYLGAAGASLSIKPATSACGQGVARWVLQRERERGRSIEGGGKRKSAARALLCKERVSACLCGHLSLQICIRVMV